MRKERTMNKTILKQYDSRWSKKPYPSGCTVGGCGCGLLACTHIAMEQASKKDWTPENLRTWMLSKGFAVRNQGTRWEGITETLKHIGHKSVVRIYADPMSKAFEELDKGNRIGILLFNGNKAPNGIRWTASGHYVAFTDYKVKDKKHYFYCKDSGGRNHDGWYTYENSMRGCISKVWIVERVGEQVVTKKVKATTYRPTEPYEKTMPSKVLKMGSNGTQVKRLQRFLNWCIKAKLSVDGVFGENADYAVRVYQKTYKLTVDGIFGANSLKKAKSIVESLEPKTWADKANEWAIEIASSGKYKYKNYGSSEASKQCPICHKGSGNGWNCIGFAFAIWKHGGGVKNKCNCGVISNGVWEQMLNAKTDAAAGKIATERTGVSCKVIRKSGKAIPISKLEKGDILGLFNGKTFWHVIYYMGDGKYAESTSHSTPNVRANKKLSDSYKDKIKVAVRYTGK